MPRVICALPNASDNISGVEFTLLQDGRRISAEISEEQAAIFASVPGYELDEEGEDDEAPPPPPKAPTLTKAQQKAADKKAADAKPKAAETAPVVDTPPAVETPVVDTPPVVEGAPVVTETNPTAEVF